MSINTAYSVHYNMFVIFLHMSVKCMDSVV